jgi:fibronectin type 3 domain-containing protein
MYLAQPALTISNAGNGIQGKWNQVTGATGYAIYRSEFRNGAWTSWTSLGTTKGTAKSFTDKTVKSGVAYKYTICAVNGSSKSSSVETNQTVFLSVPTVKISSGITGVNVSWSKIEGATSYLVYRREVVNGKWSNWSVLKTVTETSIVDETAKSGTQYRYTVRALSGKSKSVYTSTGTLNYLATPTVKAEKVTDGIKVNWTQVAGVTGYTIYRAELGANGKWSKWVTLGTASANHSSCKDKTAKANVTYKYTVRAVNGKVKSAYVSGAQVTN